MGSTRKEHDSLGEIEVEEEKYWGAKTERSRRNFRIGRSMPEEVIEAFAVLKSAAATTNEDLGVLDSERADLIRKAADEIISGKLAGEFPLVVYQTGSGTDAFHLQHIPC